MEEETVVARVAQQLLEDARAELARADDKATSTLSTISAILAIAGVTPGGLQSDQETVSWGWIGGLLVCVLAVVLLMLAGLPRFTTGSQRQMIAHFGDLARARHDRDLGSLLARQTVRPDDVVLKELRTISKIVLAKYRLTRLGILCAAVGGVLLVMSTL